MAPTLVVAGSPYTVYPGGVIAIRAADFLGPARGTLTTEADARSVCGTVVRDTQTFTSSLSPNHNAAFAECDDTLVIDFADIPDLESDMRYSVFASVLVEGDWNPSDALTYGGLGDPERFPSGACALDWYGDSLFFLSATDLAILTGEIRRHVEHFWYGQYGGTVAIGDVDGDEVLHWRAMAKSGTSIEWLIDQIVLLPRAGSNFDWSGNDFRVVGGAHNTFTGTPYFGGIGSDEFVDGDDGGTPSANGNYTWNPFIGGVFQVEQTDYSGGDGGGDLQKKSSYDDAEYMLRIDVEEGEYFLGNSLNGSLEPSASHLYGLHGVRYKPAREIANDPLDRTVTPLVTPYTHDITKGWGLGPQQYGWFTSHFNIGAGGADDRALADGSQGVHEIKIFNSSGINLFTSNMSGEQLSYTHASIASCHLRSLDFSGELTTDSNPTFASAPWPDSRYIVKAVPMLQRRVTFSGIGYPAMGIVFDQVALEIRFQLLVTLPLVDDPDNDPPPYVTTDVSGWWSPGDWIGFRIRKDGFRVRMKAWDASGAEPGTWDVDELLPLLHQDLSLHDHPYTTHPEYDEGAVQTGMAWRTAPAIQSQAGFSQALPGVQSDIIQFWYRNIVVDYDPGGDPASGFASMEFPDGGADHLDEMEFEYGADQIIYWGRQDWTEQPSWDPGFGYVSLAAKTWSDAAAADHQQTDLLWLYLRSVHDDFTIVSMNWRSAERNPGTRRVLIGDR